MGDIKNFYDGSTIFMTGASGFLGKIALEKLLRTCDIRRIFVMLRTKKDKDPKKRLEELFDVPAFDRVHKEKPNFKERVTLVHGDCQLPNLGMSDQDISILCAEVSVIVHWAATVRFDENLKTATFINVRSVRDLLRLARRMPNLKSFIHCSTAFSNCTGRKEIDEIFYDPPKGINLIDAMEALDESIVAEISPKILGEVPNTYIYTKAVAENLLMSEGKGLPLGIVRPSLVLPCYKEPLPGWVDNVYGIIGLSIGTALGVVRVQRCNRYSVFDSIPADIVVNTTLASAWDVNRRRLNGDFSSIEPPIFNCVSSPEKPMTWDMLIHYGEKYAFDYASPHVVWHYMLFTVYNKYLFKLLVFLLHHVPAYIIDFGSICVGRKPAVVKIYKKIDKFQAMVEYFSTREWSFRNENTQALWNRMSPQDKDNFLFSMRDHSWDEFFLNYIIGARLYLLKDPLDTIPAGRRKLRMVQAGHYAICAILLFILYQLLSWVFACVVG